MNAITFGSILAGAAVALGAFGAHGLREVLAERGRVGVWETAVLYHLLHAIAICVVGVWRRCDAAAASRRAVGASAPLWGAGVLLFSGSLYGLSLGLPGWLGPITPLGGLCLIAGWVALALGAFRRTAPRE